MMSHLAGGLLHLEMALAQPLGLDLARQRVHPAEPADGTGAHTPQQSHAEDALPPNDLACVKYSTTTKELQTQPACGRSGMCQIQYTL